MAERLFLHVGTPNAGTTYVQTVLWQNVAALRDNGLLLPGNPHVQWSAAKGVTSRRGIVNRTRQRGAAAWTRLAGEIAGWPGAAVVSHELLAPATREQADSAKHELGTTAEMHLILTVAAWPAQLAGAWQEQVKAGSRLSYDRFLDLTRSGTGRGGLFWRVQDVLALAERWRQRIPAQRIHVVTCPPTDSDSAADSALLWQRYASVLGMGDVALDLEVPQQHVAVGVVETELLRRIHATRDYRFRDGHRHLWTRRLLAGGLLARRPGAPIRLPADRQEWIQQRADAMAAGIERQGYQVVGDLADLGWQPPSADSRLVADVSQDELDEVSAWTIGRLQEALVDRQPEAPYPPVGPDDGIDGIIELLEHIRAADTGTTPRPAETGPRRRRLRRLAARLRR